MLNQHIDKGDDANTLRQARSYMDIPISRVTASD